MAQYYNSALTGKIGPEKMTVGWPWRFFIFSIIVLLTAVMVWAGLAFGYRTYLENRIAAVDASIQQLSESVPQDQQQNLITFYSQLANLQNVLVAHTGTARLLPLLQQNTNRLVSYRSIDLRVGERRIVLDGVAQSYQVLAQQLEALNRMPIAESVIVNESRAEEGRVVFRLTVTLTERAFQSSLLPQS
jgi:hypothetical protein